MTQHHKISSARANGFTLIELMLSMAFLASVFMTATILFTQMLTIYNKGVTVKQLTQTTRTLAEEFNRAGNSASGTISLSNNCLSIGSTYYIWNWTHGSIATYSGFVQPWSSTNEALYKYSTGEYINFVKTTDASDCADMQIDKTKATAMLPDQLRVYRVLINQLSPGLVRFRMTIGTYTGPNSQNNPITSTRTACSSNNTGAFCQQMEIQTVFRLANGG